MNKLFSALFIFSVFSVCKAQSATTIIGKWKFEEVYNKNEMKASEADRLKLDFYGFTLLLDQNHHYCVSVSNMKEKNEGIYAYAIQSKKLTLNSTSLPKRELTLTILTDETLLLEIDKGKSIVLRKVIGSKEKAFSQSEPNSISTEQLCKIWYLQQQYLLNEPNKASEKNWELVKLLYKPCYDFKIDSTYTLQMGEKRMKGKWYLSKDSKTLTAVSKQGKTIVWKIKKATENDLELITDNPEEVWIFSTQK